MEVRKDPMSSNPTVPDISTMGRIRGHNNVKLSETNTIVLDLPTTPVHYVFYGLEHETFTTTNGKEAVHSNLLFQSTTPARQKK